MNRNERKLALQKEIDDREGILKETAKGYKNLGKDALLIGGITILGYSLFQLFTHDEEYNEQGEGRPNTSILGSTLKATATSVLLALAKDKLDDILSDTEDSNA